MRPFHEDNSPPPPEGTAVWPPIMKQGYVSMLALFYWPPCWLLPFQFMVTPVPLRNVVHMFVDRQDSAKVFLVRVMAQLSQEQEPTPAYGSIPTSQFVTET